MLERVTLVGGQQLNAHAEGSCVGPACPIHRPSSHHMSEWRQVWNPQAKVIMRVCYHGFGHPDPDDKGAPYVTHQCDRCCEDNVIEGELVSRALEPSSLAPSSSSQTPAALLAGPTFPGLGPCSGSSPSQAFQTGSDPCQA